VVERSGFHPGRRARDHLRAVARAARIPESRADETIEIVALQNAARRRVGQYSLGMRQRLALAAALLGDPRNLILDEPANGLDPQGIRWLRDFMRWFASQGRTVLVSSHVLAEMSQTADAVIVIARGRVVAQGPIEELVAGRGGAVEVQSPARSGSPPPSGRGASVWSRAATTGSSSPGPTPPRSATWRSASAWPSTGYASAPRRSRTSSSS
jgi:ABC-2 type transport system ATP-binding protein